MAARSDSEGDEQQDEIVENREEVDKQILQLQNEAISPFIVHCNNYVNIGMMAAYRHSVSPVFQAWRQSGKLALQ